MSQSLSRLLLWTRNLFKGAVGVLSGAAITTIILAVQTYILYRQTGLIGMQTEAMSLDQVAHLRDHIRAASSVEATTQRLIKGLESFRNGTYTTDVPRGQPITVSDYVLDACATTDCSTASFDSALRSISEDKPVLEDSLSLATLRIAFYLRQLERTMSSVMDSREQIDLVGPQRDPLQVEKDLVTSGMTQCFLIPEAGRDLSERLVRIRAATSTASAIQFRIGNPASFTEMTSKFPQTNNNTKMDVLRLEEVAAEIANAFRPGTWQSRSYTFGLFTHALGNDLTQAVSALQALDTDCASTLGDDSRALKDMDSVLRGTHSR